MADSENMNVPYDIASIRVQAKQSIQEGAVTKDYRLDINQACKLLNDALATEIMCVLRYRHHQVVAKGIDRPQVAAEFKEHADEEEKHMYMIANRINQLGGDPDFNPMTIGARTATEYSSSNDLLTMIKDDLIAERIAIMTYRKMIEWFGAEDPTTRRMLEQILKDEEDHADDLADLLPVAEK
jgi:bacterioferritin